MIVTVAIGGGKLDRFSSPNCLSSAHVATLAMDGAASSASANALRIHSVRFRVV